VSEVASLQLRRFGDAIRYDLQDTALAVRGRHLLGSQYALHFTLRDLRPDHQTFWIKNSRQGVQLLLTAVFVVVFGLTMMISVRFPSAVREHPRWFLTILSVSLAALLASVFARRVEVAAFAYRSGAEAFRVPAWGCKEAERRAFLEALASRISRANGETVTSGAQ
jgi:hypothetical protein